MKNLVLSKAELFSEMIGIGIFMSGKRPDFKSRKLTPEMVIIHACREAKKNMLVLNLLYTWMRNNSDVLYVDAFRSALKEENDVAVRVMVASLLATLNEKRFSSLIKRLGKFDGDSNEVIDRHMYFSSEIGQSPYEKEFFKRGLKISKIEIEDGKKFIDTEFVVEFNPFMRCRYLFGPGVRADVAALMMLGLDSYSEIKEVLGCSHESAYRNFKQLKIAGWPLA